MQQFTPEEKQHLLAKWPYMRVFQDDPGKLILECINCGYKLESFKWKSLERHSPGKHLCGRCYEHQIYNIDNCKRVARERNGECLSDVCRVCDDVLQWRCTHGHEWTATAHSVIMMNRWCGYCRTSLYENALRNILVSIFSTPAKTYEFRNRRDILRTAEGSVRELDCYDVVDIDGGHSIKLAAEHNGVQHYKVDGYLTKTQERLERIRERDRERADLCAALDIKLVVTRYDTRIQDLPREVSDQLVALGVPHDREKALGLTVDVSRCIYNDLNDRKLVAARLRAAELGCELVTAKILNSKTCLETKCAEGHIRKISYHDLMNGDRECGQCRSITDDIMRRAAAERNCEFISSGMDGPDRRWKTITYRCPAGHLCENIAWGNFAKGTRCKACSRKFILVDTKSCYATHIKAITEGGFTYKNDAYMDETDHMRCPLVCRYGHNICIPMVTLARRYDDGNNLCDVCQVFAPREGRLYATVDSLIVSQVLEHYECVRQSEYISHTGKMDIECEPCGKKLRLSMADICARIKKESPICCSNREGI